MTNIPKYARVEVERRWLVDLAEIDLGACPYREIEDLYITGSRLRLRKGVGADGGGRFQFGNARSFGQWRLTGTTQYSRLIGRQR